MSRSEVSNKNRVRMGRKLDWAVPRISCVVCRTFFIEVEVEGRQRLEIVSSIHPIRSESKKQIRNKQYESENSVNLSISLFLFSFSSRTLSTFSTLTLNEILVHIEQCVLINNNKHKKTMIKNDKH